MRDNDCDKGMMKFHADSQLPDIVAGKMKSLVDTRLFKRCGERGIRTPGTFRYNGFQDRRIKPLCHFSGAKL
jgi:hypothetical protein